MIHGTRSQTKGFTLIELLVVIAIIGILSSIVLASLNTARTKSRNASYIAQANAYRSALELYFLENGSYPQTTSAYACIGTGHQSNSCVTTDSNNYPESDTQSVNFRSALAPYITSTTRAGAQSGAIRGAIYGSHANPATTWYRMIVILEGVNTPCPGAWTNEVQSYATNAGRTRCIYNHPR